MEALSERKFGPGGPFHPDTPGPWKDSGKIRSAAPVHSEEFKECVALQAQYIFDRFGKFPGTVPSMIATIYLQAHHLDLEFYDEFYKPGAYLRTHADHMARWHGPDDAEPVPSDMALLSLSRRSTLASHPLPYATGEDQSVAAMGLPARSRRLAALAGNPSRYFIL